MHFTKLILAAALGLGLSACMDSNSSMTTSNSQSTLRLSARTIALSGADTTSTVSATLTCGCPFMMEQTKCWGDTSCIRFNASDLGMMRNDQGVRATVDRSRATNPRMVAYMSFLVNDRMMKTMCRDTIMVEYMK